MRITSLLL